MAAPGAVAVRMGDAFYRALLENHPEPTFSLAADGEVSDCNRAFARFVGAAESQLRGRSLATLIVPEQEETVLRAWSLVRGGAPQSWRAQFVGPDGSVSIGQVTLAPVVVDGAFVGAQGVARDVTVYQVIEEQLRARVLTDPLTGLANRTQLYEAVERACRRASTPGAVAVLFIDLDDFKLVNDALGHAAGDRLLQEVADRLRRATRGADLAARLGGDEFAVVLDGLASPGDATVVVERVFAALQAPVAVGPRPLTVAASLGVAYWDGTATASELLRNADLAMYRAKASGKGRSAVYDAGMQRDLREAIRGGSVTAAFQPIVEIATGRVVKAEALARWRHPGRGSVPPSLFVPLAEEMGLIEELGALMLRHGCERLRLYESRGIGVTVNVSGRQVEGGGLARAVSAALAASGAAAGGLTLEITESVAMRQPEVVLGVLAEVAALGVGLAIDDFGTGYSSLAYLHRFPMNVLKIDRSFVSALDATPADPHAATLVRTMVTIAASLGLVAVAEGVETEAQRDALAALGCPLAQGYLFGRPEE
jgi:diguanylate cyclase (GGDEF)-like protein/PAS domain S-box-containing protein